MKYLLLLLAFAFPRCMQAAPPSCWPGDPTAAETVPTVNIQSGGACLVWHCDINHQWKKAFICGTWSEATDQAIVTLRTAMNSDKATKDALWTATFNQPIVPDSADDALITSAKLVPVPTKIPPSGLVTTDTRVYKLSSNVNSAVWQLVGTIPLGKPCDASQRMGSYYRVDRTLVKYPPGTIMPLTTFAYCGP